MISLYFFTYFWGQLAYKKRVEGRKEKAKFIDCVTSSEYLLSIADVLIVLNVFSFWDSEIWKNWISVLHSSAEEENSDTL